MHSFKNFVADRAATKIFHRSQNSSSEPGGSGD